MLRAAACLLLLCAPAYAGDSCLPDLTLEPAWTACTKDSDCALAGDGCRSCAHFLPVNKKHVARVTKLDQRERAAVQCVLTCEACARSLVRVRCVDRQCTASPATPPK